MTHKKILRRSIPEGSPRMTSIPDVLNRIYAARGLKTEEELELQLKRMLPATSLKGLSAGVQILSDAIIAGEKILIVGDFDADGATSTTLAVEALTAMGASSPTYLVPDRFKFGYGLTPEIVDLAHEQKPSVIVTVDNGISSFEGVERAKSLGMTVVVTDHHLPSDALPDAHAIVNPAQPGCNFPSKNLAGVGVIFYVMSALRMHLRNEGWFERSNITEPNMATFLDLVALGTVADLVPLDYNNRVLVEQGIRRIRGGKGRPGISALFEVAGKEAKNALTSDLGFVAGPRLNAAGRLDDMATGIECLRSRDMIEARQRARVLNELNQTRKQIEDEMRRDAEAILLQLLETQDEQAWGVVLYEEHWHQGVIGILASRVKEKLNRPVIAFAPASDDPSFIDVLKGSARSIPGFHMRDALDLIAKRKPHLLSKFGGHAMAAGMSLKVEGLPEFRNEFNAVVRESIKEEDLDVVIYTDGELSDSEFELEVVDMLERAGPWGQKFPEPKFDLSARVVQSKVLKEKHLKLVLELSGGRLLDAIQFSSPYCSYKLSQVRVVYRPSVNEFRGRRNVQLLVDYLEPC